MMRDLNDGQRSAMKGSLIIVMVVVLYGTVHKFATGTSSCLKKTGPNL